MVATEEEWKDNKRLIVQDEYLAPWSMPTFRKLWGRDTRTALDSFVMQTLQAGGTQPGGVIGPGLSEVAAVIRLAALWERVQTIIRHVLSTASPKVNARALFPSHSNKLTRLLLQIPRML